MREVKSGSDYFIRDNGWGDQHLNGKRVTALENGGGWAHADHIEVRCHCCGKTFKVGVDKLD